MDGLIPECRQGACVIPPLTAAARRILELRGLIIKLHGLVDAGTVLQMADADLDDLALLAEVEALLKTQPRATDG